ncbi:MAG: hypothetical protein JWO36_922 [Myxococcales bacterium]|nr:hypothetical protein [Myxococcales bacterium]
MTPDHLTTSLEAALLRELRERYKWENESRFGGRLRAPVIVLSDTVARLGRWIRETNTLEISRSLVLSKPWLEVISVFEHEMAHQFVEQVLGVVGEPAHGPTFQRVCLERGIDGRAAGAPVAASVPAGETDRILERIRKLLALAGSSNENEAEIAMRRAHELMLRHNIDTTKAATHRSYEVRHLGDPAKRRTRVEADIAGLLSEFFFVDVIRVPTFVAATGARGHVYEIIGTLPNVEMASHVFAFLLATADRLWAENRGDARVRSGRDRLAYQSGVIRGFRDKLLGERVELRGTGLVWVEDGARETFYRARHPRIVTRRRTFVLNRALAAGHEAGRKVVLHKPVENRSSGERRLLRD